MNPFKILLFLLSVFVILLIVSLFFPDDGIHINEKFSLHFITQGEIFNPDTFEYADISSIISQSMAINDSILTGDLVFPGGEEFTPDTIRANEDSLKIKIQKIEFPEDDNTMLYPIFRQFRKLNTTGELIRIMHYGDSQIEGDRMTSFIRYRLQRRFGGSGIGLQPVVSLYGYQLSLKHTASDNWLRYTAFGSMDTTLGHNNYGALACFARFTPNQNDILLPGTDVHEAWIELTGSGRSWSGSAAFHHCRIFFGNNPEPVLYKLYANDSLIDADFLPVCDGLEIKHWHFNQPPTKLRFSFHGSVSPDFYAIALDDEKGVAVDNIPMRGSAGLVFTKMNQYLLKEMFDSLNVKMLILQFGGNVVPYIAENYSYYAKWFTSQLRTLKNLCPDIPIVVIGVSDMSTKEKDRFVTYSNLEKIRDALKSASFNEGCAYWDMFEAMGGRNSMPSWVYAQPPLASSDFVHFNQRGARVIAEMFCNALIYEYESYLENLNR